jgi:hypothetical protein
MRERNAFNVPGGGGFGVAFRVSFRVSFMSVACQIRPEQLFNVPLIDIDDPVSDAPARSLERGESTSPNERAALSTSLLWRESTPPTERADRPTRPVADAPEASGRLSTVAEHALRPAGRPERPERPIERVRRAPHRLESLACDTHTRTHAGSKAIVSLTLGWALCWRTPPPFLVRLRLRLSGTSAPIGHSLVGDGCHPQWCCSLARNPCSVRVCACVWCPRAVRNQSNAGCLLCTQEPPIALVRDCADMDGFLFAAAHPRPSVRAMK